MLGHAVSVKCKLLRLIQSLLKHSFIIELVHILEYKHQVMKSETVTIKISICIIVLFIIICRMLKPAIREVWLSCSIRCLIISVTCAI